MKYDDALSLLGEFGRYQKIVYTLLVLPIMFVSVQIMSPVFTLATPKHRCALPGVNNDTYAIQDRRHQDMLDLYIPWDNINEDYSKCRIYTKAILLLRDSTDNNTEYMEVDINSTTTEACTRWVYDDTVFEDTVITDTNLVCSATIYRAHATTSLNIGAIFSFMVGGPLSDRFGRKLVSMIDLVVMIVSSALLIWLPNIYVFIAIRALIGFGFGVFFNIIFVYAMEFIGSSKRTVYGIIVNHVWAVGIMFQAVAAYYIRSWRLLQLVTSTPLVIFLLYWWKLPNSGRWLFANRHIKEGKKVLRAISRVNKAYINTDNLVIDDIQGETRDHNDEDKGMLMLQLVKSKTLAVRSMIVFFNWFIVSMLYYGLSLNVRNLSGDLYINFAVSGAMEIIGYTICIPGMYMMGRKKFHCSCMLLGGVVLLLVIVPELVGNASTKWLVILFAQVGKLASSAAYAVIYLFSAELFPTVLRGTTLGMSAACATAGGIVAPYVVEMANMLEGHYAKIVPLIIFGITSFMAGLTSLVLPETSNEQLPESISDMKAQKRLKTGAVPV